MQSWGTQTLEPIAQLDLPPRRNRRGRFLPNEDAQSLIFDDSNLFKVNKFSGWDRVEGGSRANVGVQYTAQFNRGGNVNVLFGQSYQLFGQNSFALGGTTNTGLDSGLDTALSDYVARVILPAERHLDLFTSRFRLTEDDFTLQRSELESRRQLRPLDHLRDVRQLRRPAAARVPEAPRGRPRQRTAEARPELGLVAERHAMTC